jgi:hypothetical protein
MDELKKDALDILGIKKLETGERIDLLEMKSIKGGVARHSPTHCNNQCHSKHCACHPPDDV